MEKHELEKKYLNKTIKIVEMEGEPNNTNLIGVVEYIDDAGQLHGTWSGLALIPGLDKFEIVE